MVHAWTLLIALSHSRIVEKLGAGGIHDVLRKRRNRDQADEAQGR
jgi:hypothetical protein